MNLGLERGVIEATDHSIRLVLSLRPQLERLELFCSVYRLPVIVEDGRGVQRLGVYLVAVIPQSYDDGVWVEYDLHILRLSDIALWTGDGEGNEVVSIVGLESQRNFIPFDVVAPLVQREAGGSGRIRCLLRSVRIFEHPYKEMLSWVEVVFAPITSGAAPWAARCRCTDRHSASRAAIFALLFATALANCLSLHIEQTFRSAVCDALRFPEGDR